MNIYPISLSLVKKIDTEIIPSVFYQAVIKRNYYSLVNIIKRNPLLTNQVISFYYTTLQTNANFLKNNKSSCQFKIPWQTNTENPIVLTPDEQYQLYAFITLNNRNGVKNQSNFEFLIFSIGNYMTQLKTAQRAVNQKQDICCYYYLGVNIKTNEQLKNFLKLWINIPTYSISNI
jgi:hypothetical protein